MIETATEVAGMNFMAAMAAGMERLGAKRLLDPKRGSVTLRLPSLEARQVTCRGASPPVEHAIEGSGLESMMLACRPGIGAILRAQPPWGSLVSTIRRPMPALFDEQVRQLGPNVPVLSNNSADTLDAKDLATIRRGGTVYLRGDEVIVLGYTLERAIFNLELFEKCAQSFVLAELSGRRVTTIPWWVQWIAFGRLKRDEKKAAAAYQAGELPSGLGGY